MAKNRETKIELTAYDDLFQTDESRAEAALSKIRDIPISEIDEFPDHPFKVLMDEDMEQLVESVKRNGVMTPATVRLKEDGRYELISGHRRKKACELAGLETIKCEVKDLTRDEAIIIMVESNLQRSVILPSEKAFAYKMRLEAMNRQGQRSDLTSCPMGNKLTSASEVAKDVGDSERQIFRFIRLTELVPEILQMVDERQIAFRPAVEISYLAEEQQYTLLEAMSYNDANGESNSITNQKQYLEDYARRNGFTNIRHFTDDGFSGVNFNRPSFQELIKEVEAGNVATIIVKDMSRLRSLSPLSQVGYTQKRNCLRTP